MAPSSAAPSRPASASEWRCRPARPECTPPTGTGPTTTRSRPGGPRWTRRQRAPHPPLQRPPQVALLSFSMTRVPVAIVTGSNRGIGPEIVRTLQGAGYVVVSNGRSARTGPGDVHVRADAASPAGAKRLAAAAKKLGGLDLLVCAVGDFFETPVSRMEIDAWEDLFTSNLKTAWVCCRAALPLLRKRG